jgi:CHASE1-domain containing sensor protein
MPVRSAMIASRLKPYGSGSLRMVLVLWLLGLVLSGLAGWRVHGHNDTVRDTRLKALVDERERFIQVRLLRYARGRRGTRGAVRATGGDALTRQRFEDYMSARNMAREFPGARGLGFVRRLPRADEKAFVVHMRTEGRADFAIRDFAALIMEG